MKRNTKVAIVTIVLVGAFALYELVPWPTSSREQENFIYPGGSMSKQVSPPSNGIVVSAFHGVVEFRSNVSMDAYIRDQTDFRVETTGLYGRLECQSSETIFVYNLSKSEIPYYLVSLHASASVPYNVTLTVTIDFLNFADKTDWLLSILAGIGAFIWVALLLTAKAPPVMMEPPEDAGRGEETDKNMDEGDEEDGDRDDGIPPLRRE